MKPLAKKITGLLIFLCVLLVSYSVPAEEPTEEADFLSARKAFDNGVYDIAEKKLEALLKDYPNPIHFYEVHTLLGRCLYYQNNLPGAAGEFEAALNAPTGSRFQDEAFYWTGEINLKNGEYKKALELYEKVIEEFPSSRYLSYAIYSKGWAYYKLGYYDEAVKCFKGLAARYPYEKIAIEAKFRVGECEYLLGRYSNAVKELEECIEKFPVSEKTADAHYLMGEAQFYLARYDDSIANFEKALSISPKSKWAGFARYRLAWALSESGKIAEGSRLFAECVRNEDNNFLKSASLMRMAHNYERLGNAGEAKKIYDRVLKDYSGMETAAEAYYKKARYLTKDGKYDDAEVAVKEGIRKYPLSGYLGELRYELAMIYRAQSKNDEALGEFACVQSESRNVNLQAGAITKTGDIYFDRKNYKRAVESYDKVLDEYPDSPESDYAQYQIGNIFFATGRYEEAALAYQTELTNFPKTILREETLFRLGMACFKKQDYEHAVSVFKSLSTEFPAGGLAGRSKIYLANSLYNTGSYKDALAIFVDVGKESSDSHDKMMALYQEGWCCHNMGKEDAAVDAFNKFLKSYPDSEMAPDALFWLGDYYNAKAKYDHALEYYSAIVKNFPASDIAENALYQSAIMLNDEARSQEALAKFEEVTSKYPNGVLAGLAYRKMAKIRKGGGDYAAAIECLKRSLTAENNELNAQTQYEIAECYELKPDQLKAQEEYLKVPAIYSKGKFWSIRAQLKCAKIFEDLGKTADAKMLYEKLAEMDVEESAFAKKRLEWIRWKTAK